MPAVAGFRKQGANNGACLAFLISAPETGVDSIALTYSLLGPLIAAIRPITAFFTAFTAGLLENFTGPFRSTEGTGEADRTCLVDGCCDGVTCDPVVHASHHTTVEKLAAGLRFAYNDLMDDLAGWFVLGVLLAGGITVLAPTSFFDEVLGQGLVSYLAVLAVSLPMYVCASASTPIAAALVFKGLSPGAALVFLLAGPATNVATVAMVGGMLGVRTLAIYLASIVLCALGMAFVTDWLFQTFAITTVASAVAGPAELLPEWLHWFATVVLALLMVRALWRTYGRNLLSSLISRRGPQETGCTGPSCCGDDGRSGST